MVMVKQYVLSIYILLKQKSQTNIQIYLKFCISQQYLVAVDSLLNVECIVINLKKQSQYIVKRFPQSISPIVFIYYLTVCPCTPPQIVVYSENGRTFERDNSIMVIVQVSVISITGHMRNLEEVRVDVRGHLRFRGFSGVESGLSKCQAIDQYTQTWQGLEWSRGRNGVQSCFCLGRVSEVSRNGMVN